MKVMEVAVEAVVTRIIQFSLEPAPQGSFPRWLRAALTLVCFTFAFIPNLQRWATTTAHVPGAFDIAVVICSGVLSSLLLGAQVAYMWMVIIDINRRQVRLEFLAT